MSGILCAALCAALAGSAGPVPLKSVLMNDGKPIPVWSVCKEASGHVKATTKTSVTISDWNKPGLLITLPVYGELAAGSVDDSASDCNAYRVRDLKIGDGITLYTLVENNVTYCVSICIRERPGGLVPKSQKPRKLRPYHEQQDALNATRKQAPVPGRDR